MGTYDIRNDAFLQCNATDVVGFLQDEQGQMENGLRQACGTIRRSTGTRGDRIGGWTVIVSVTPHERQRLVELFRECRRDRVHIDSVLEGSFGEAFTDSLTRPTVARLDSGSFSMLAGAAGSPAARNLLGFPLPRYVTPQDEAWRELLADTYFGQAAVLTFTTCSAASVEPAHLEELEAALPPDYTILRLDAALAERCGNELGNEYFLEAFHSVADFLARGLGYCVIYSGRIVAAASSTAASSRAIDIEIETAKEHRCRGLGSAVAARLVRECLAKGIEPCWLAANKQSERLAVHLGFTRGDSYEALALGEPYRDPGD